MMSSNLGAAEMSAILSGGVGFGAAAPPDSDRVEEQLRGAAIEAARRHFSPEFMNRIDKTVVFRPLDHEHLDKVLDLELRDVQRRILRDGAIPFSFECAAPVRERLLREGTDRRYGARHLRRAIERLLVAPLARLVTSGQVTVLPGELPPMTYFSSTGVGVTISYPTSWNVTDLADNEVSVVAARNPASADFFGVTAWIASTGTDEDVFQLFDLYLDALEQEREAFSAETREAFTLAERDGWLNYYEYSNASGELILGELRQAVGVWRQQRRVFANRVVARLVDLRGAHDQHAAAGGAAPHRFEQMMGAEHVGAQVRHHGLPRRGDLRRAGDVKDLRRLAVDDAVVHRAGIEQIDGPPVDVARWIGLMAVGPIPGDDRCTIDETVQQMPAGESGRARDENRAGHAPSGVERRQACGARPPYWAA